MRVNPVAINLVRIDLVKRNYFHSTYSCTIGAWLCLHHGTPPSSSRIVLSLSVSSRWIQSWVMWSLHRDGPGSCEPSTEMALGHVSPPQRRPWVMWALHRDGPGSCEPSTETVLGHVSPPQRRPWVIWALHRDGPGSCDPSTETALGHVIPPPGGPWIPLKSRYFSLWL